MFTARYGLDLCVLCVDLRTNGDYFPIQHLTGFYNRDGVCLLRGRTRSLCVLCGFENKQRLFLYTALTGWFL